MRDLPREIRDMVYSAMLDRGYAFKNIIQIDAVAHETHLAPLAATYAGFPPRVCRIGLKKYQHCWDRDYCEIDFIQELAEASYREKRFDFQQQNLYLLPTFLGRSNLATVSSPQPATLVPTELVRKLRICVGSSDAFWKLYPENPGWKFAIQNLEALLSLKTKAKIEIILAGSPFIHYRMEQEIEAAINKYQALFPVFAKLKKEKHDVSMRFGHVKFAKEVPTWMSNQDLAAIVQVSIDMVSQSCLMYSSC